MTADYVSLPVMGLRPQTGATSGPRLARPRQHPREAKSVFCRDFRETGATGLEPATSGVTGHFEGHDG
jgi:hypothetical protein